MSTTDVAEAFARDVAEHQLTVLHSDGLYRHLRFAKPGTGLGHFDLVTWPGYLAISGDMDGYVFARHPDMLEFFRAKSGWNSNSINPQYWAEKVTAGCGVKTYSQDKLREIMAEDVEANEEEFPGLAKAVQEEILSPHSDYDLDFEEHAREALRDFEYTHETDGKTRTFRFLDTWEWEIDDWDFHYLRACHAIQWGIDQYDQAAKATARELAEVSA